MSKELYKLPKGWEWTKIGVIYDIVGGGTPSTDVEEYWNGDIPWITSADIYGLKDYRPRKQITKAALENSATNLVPEGSLIVVTRVGLGKVTLAKIPLCFSQDSQALIDRNSIVYPDYALYYLSQASQIFKYENRGTTIAGITKKQLSELLFALPPLPEQQRIVEAIEQQFSRLDEGVTLLQQSQKRLKSYRASLLKAAVEGELTAGWREAHPDTEPASELLKLILAERREKWEQEQIAKGRDPKKMKYIEPVGPDVSSLSKLPDGWCWATVEQISTKVVDGTHHTPTYTSAGIPFISVKDVRDDRIFFDDCKCISIEEHKSLIQRCYPEYNDVLITKSGTIGRVAVVKTEQPFSLFVSVALIKTCKRSLNQSYFKLALEYYILGINIQQNIKGGLIKNLHLEDLRVIPVKLPPLAEQEQIVSLVEERLSIIDNLEATIETALKRAERLRQSILHQAFTGKLVPQDPDDEPASVLLKRIREEREQSAPKEQRKTKPVRKKAVPTRVVNVSDEPPEPIDTEDFMQGNLWESIEA